MSKTTSTSRHVGYFLFEPHDNRLMDEIMEEFVRPLAKKKRCEYFEGYNREDGKNEHICVVKLIGLKTLMRLVDDYYMLYKEDKLYEIGKEHFDDLEAKRSKILSQMWNYDSMRKYISEHYEDGLLGRIDKLGNGDFGTDYGIDGDNDDEDDD